MDIKKTRSKSATDRNNALRNALKYTKDTLGGTSAEIKWEGERGVQFEGEWVYKQPPGQSLGEFGGKLNGHTMPED